MIKKRSIQSLFENLRSKNSLTVMTILIFAVIFTTLLSVKYFLFQNIITENNTSKKDIYASKTITVIDTHRTDLQRKAAMRKVPSVLMLAESSYIKNDLQMLISSIERILSKDVGVIEKKNEFHSLFDMVSQSQKQAIADYFTSAKPENINIIFSKATDDLNSVLMKINISEKDFGTDMVSEIIYTYIGNGGKSKTKEAVVISAMLEQVIIPNIVENEQATKVARENAMNVVTPYTKTFQKGDKILYEGQQVNKFERAVLKEAGYNILDLNVQSILGLFCVVATLLTAFLYYVYSFERQYFSRNYLFIIALLALMLVAIGTVKPDNLSVYIIPVPVFTILLSILCNPRIAFIATLGLVSIISVAFMLPVQSFIVFVLVSLFISMSMAKIKHSKRVDLVKIGAEATLLMVFLILSIYSIEKGISEVELHILVSDVINAAGICFLSGVLALGMLPLFESAFKIITPYQLAELGDTNQPLLKRLQLEAPGTFIHSNAVANLAENAAEAIGADPILARVGAMYHDIGKLKRPLFFVENQSYFGIENPHTKINPRLSKMVVTAHTKDGAELAKDYGLPQVIQDLIVQHHGESLASYFYHEAIKQEGEENITEEQFRYNGPKPMTKEAAILMIADAVEAAAKTLKDNYTPEALQALIDKIIKERLNDGQLSESHLTLKDLKIIAQTFDRILRATYHQRIKYHDDIVMELKKKNSERKDG